MEDPEWERPLPVYRIIQVLRLLLLKEKDVSTWKKICGLESNFNELMDNYNFEVQTVMPFLGLTLKKTEHQFSDQLIHFVCGIAVTNSIGSISRNNTPVPGET